MRIHGIKLSAVALAAGLTLMGTTLPAAVQAEAQLYTFRRVKPPEPGQKRLITVQIALVEPVGDSPEGELDASFEGLEPLGPVAPAPGLGDAAVDRFWFHVPSEPGAHRLAKAALLVDDVPPERAIQQLVKRYRPMIQQATRGTGVSPALVLAVMMVESGGRADVTSHAGASGLMQLMPATAERFNVRDRFDPSENLRGGVAYLDWLLREFKGDALLTLAAYNAGENAVKRYGGVPPYPETRAYVPKVLGAWRSASKVCLTRQETAADHCELDRLAMVAP